MAREIEGALYKIKTDCSWSDIIIEANSKLDLYNYILDLQDKNTVVTGVSELKRDGSTPRVGFRGDKDFKNLQKERDKSE